MARTAEVVTIATLVSLLDSAKGDFAKAIQAKKVAQQVENIPDAHAMLMESVTLHENEGFKNLRKIVVKIVGKLDESTVAHTQVEKLIQLAKELELFVAE